MYSASIFRTVLMQEHQAVMEHIKRINEVFPFNIAILADLQGPKLRVGDIKDNALDLKIGDTFLLLK